MNKTILHINVKYSGGGASCIASSLHELLLESSWTSTFAYGYATGLRSESSTTSQKKSLFRIGKTVNVLENFLLHKYVGNDRFMSRNKKNQLKSLIEDSDIVHLHVLHHYYMDYVWLFEILIALNKRVLWTLHDCWHITGSSPVIHDPVCWKTNPATYVNPSSDLSLSLKLSEKNFFKKNKLINMLHSPLFVAPSPYIQELTKYIFPTASVVHINNFLNFNPTLSSPSHKHIHSFYEDKKIRVLIIAADLSCNLKIPYCDIIKLRQYTNCDIVTVGANSPYPFAENHGYVSDKNTKHKIISSCDVMLFTSRVDSFGLVIIETLSLGVPVLAYSSPVSDFIFSAIGSTTITGIDDALTILGNGRTAINSYINDGIISSVINTFSKDKIFSSYCNAYCDLLK